MRPAIHAYDEAWRFYSCSNMRNTRAIGDQHPGFADQGRNNTEACLFGKINTGMVLSFYHFCGNLPFIGNTGYNNGKAQFVTIIRCHCKMRRGSLPARPRMNTDVLSFG